MTGTQTDALTDALQPSSLLTRDLGLIARICLAVGGLVIFVPTLVALLANQASAEMSDYFEWAIPLVVWCAALLPRLRKVQAEIQVLAGILVMVLPFLMTSTNTVGWISLATVPWAITFATAFSWPAGHGALAIIVTAALNLAAIENAPAQFIERDISGIPEWTSPIFLLLVGLALWWLVSRWWDAARQSDSVFIELRSARETSIRAAQIRSARTAVERKIHETVLNTLNAIAQGAGRLQPELLRQECQRDLEQLQNWESGQEFKSLNDVIQQAVAVSAITVPQIQVLCDPKTMLDPQISLAVRDVLVESLRNVERHAQASRVEVHIEESESSLLIEVRDNGVGVSADAQPRFGLRNTIIGTVEALQGTVTLSQGMHGGTVLKLEVPKFRSDLESIDLQPAFLLLFRDWLSRLLMVSPAFGGLIVLPFLLDFVNNTALYVVFFLAFIAANALLAVYWNNRYTVALVYVAILCGVLTNIVVLTGQTGCETAAVTNWTIVCIDGATALLIFALRGRWDVWVPIVAVFGSSCLVLWQTPEACRSVAGVSLIDTIVYIAAATYVVMFLLNRIDRRRVVADELWHESLRNQAHIEQEEARIAGWDLIAAGTQQFFQEISEGKIDLASQNLQIRARQEEARLRRELGLSGEQKSGLWDAVVFASQAASTVGKTVETTRTSDLGNPTPVDSELADFLCALATVATTGTVSMRMFSDEGYEELLVMAPREVMREIAVAHGWSGGYQSHLNDLVLEIYVDENSSQLSIRRAIYS